MNAESTPRADERPVAFVTGSSRGIGRAVAVALAHRGYRLVLHARAEASLAETARTVHDAGASEPLLTAYDVGDPVATQRAFASVHTRFKRLDVMVNNAGVLEAGPIGMITPQHVDRLLRTNAASVLLHLHYASRLMARRRRGAIVNLTSVMGRRGAAGYCVYSASKAAVIGATLAAAKELAPLGIRVNAVAPGFVDTDMTRALDASERAASMANLPLGRASSAEEIAAMVVFLASDDALSITGQVVGVDGGFRV
jgi:3-oxoacyl-[acyl-carrier protein] reductase